MSQSQFATDLPAEKSEVDRSNSIARFQIEKGVTPGGSMREAAWFAPSPPYASSGSGSRVTDIDGNSYLDFGNNFFSLVHGHAFPPVVDAITRTAVNGTAFALPTDQALTLGRIIKDRAAHIDQVRFCNSGTEAVMFAVKAARAITQRGKIAKFEGAYHGAYDYVEVGLGTDPKDWSSPVPVSRRYSRGMPQSVCDEVIVLPWNDAETCEYLLRLHGKDLAAVLIDLVPSRIGMIPPIGDFVARVSKAAKAQGALIIADEVISFRLGLAGACPLFGLKPDIMALGKAIGGGLPVGAIAGPAEYMSVFDHVNGSPAVAQGGTFSANPLTMAAGSACLTHLGAAEIERINGHGAALRSTLNAYFLNKGVAAQLTGHGSLFRLHLIAGEIRDCRQAYAYPEQVAAIKRVHADLIAHGILLTPNCSGAISTVMTGNEVEALAEAMGAGVKAVWGL